MSGGGHGHKKGGGGGEGGGGESVPLWYVSFSDMMAVLMSMFVMLYSMSNMDTTKFQEVVVSLNGAYGILTGGPGALYLADMPTNLPSPEGTSPMQISALNVVRERVGPQLQAQASGGQIETEMTEEGLKIRFSGETLFDPGAATLKPEARELLTTVAESLREATNRIAIEGHTDSTPIHTAQFPSNWELSTARATAVVHYLIADEGFAPQRLTAAGYGEYWPIVPNDTPERRSYNRRVELLILGEEEHQSPRVDEDGNGAPDTLPGSHTAVDLLKIPKELGGPGDAATHGELIGPPLPDTGHEATHDTAPAADEPHDEPAPETHGAHVDHGH